MDADLFCFDHFVVVDFSSQLLMLFMNGSVFHIWKALLQHEHHSGTLPQRFQGHVSLLAESILCILAVLFCSLSLLNWKTHHLL